MQSYATCLFMYTVYSEGGWRSLSNGGLRMEAPVCAPAAQCGSDNWSATSAVCSSPAHCGGSIGGGVVLHTPNTYACTDRCCPFGNTCPHYTANSTPWTGFWDPMVAGYGPLCRGDSQTTGSWGYAGTIVTCDTHGSKTST